MGPLLGPHARTNRIRDTRVAEPCLPAPEDGRPGEGQRLTPDAPHNGRRPPPPGTAVPPPPRHAAPTWHASKGDSVWYTACGWRTPTARPVGGQFREGERLTTDAPHNSGRHPPENALPPPPQQATPARKGARCGAGAGPPRPHRLHPGHTGPGTPAARPRVGRQSGEGERLTSDGPNNGGRHPPPGTPFRHLHSEQRRPARPHTVGLVLGPHARTDRTRDTRVVEPRLPAPEDRRPGEGQRLTPDAPHNGGRPPPPGTAPRYPRGTQPSKGMQAKGTVLGPHTQTPAPTAHGWRTPTARPVGGQLGEGERLTSDAPHSGGRHPPRGRPSATPTASNAGPQGRTLWNRCWVPTPTPTAPGTHGSRYPCCPPQRSGGRGRDGA